MEITIEEMAAISGGSCLSQSLLPPGMPTNWFEMITIQRELDRRFEQLVW